MTQEVWLLYTVAAGVAALMLGMWIWVKISDARAKRPERARGAGVTTGDTHY